MRLSIIIVTYNTEKLTKECVQSLLENYQKYFAEKEFEIIIVDNNSSDASVESLENLLSKRKIESTIIRNKTNEGFAKACNKGASLAKGSFLCFLNSDTKVLDSGFVDMMDFMQSNTSVGIMGAKVKLESNTYEPTAGKFYTLFFALFLLMGLERLGFIRSSPEKTKQVDWVSGAVMLVKKNVFTLLKGFDEYFFMYVEDMDLCFRAKLHGVKTFFFAHCLVLHKRHASANRQFAIVHIYQGLLYFYKKHMGKVQFVCLRFLLFVKAVMAIGIGSLLGNSELRKTYQESLKISI